MQIALLGAGRIGKIHAGNIAAHPRSHLAAVVDAHGPSAESLAAAHGSVVRDEADVFADPAIDGVLIASSTPEHARQIEEAARAGKAIFCEKPIDLDLGRVRDVLTHLKAHPVPMMLAFNRRFDANFQRLKAEIDSGNMGEIEMVTILSRDPGLPPMEYIRASGGLFRDMMIHDFDVARWLLGEEFTELSAQASALVDPGVAEAGDVDTAIVTLRSATGKLVNISNSRRASYGYDQRIEVHCEKGLVAAENIRESSVVISDATGVRLDKPMHFFLERYAGAYRAEWDGFVRLVLDGEGGMPTAEDGLKSLELAERALDAIQS
ncbi:MAG: inositol 2-dehydrogenase [Pseudomonadota bacterium]